MDNTIVFAVKMMDMTGPGLSQLSANVFNTFSRISESINSTMERNQALRQSFVDLQKQVQQTNDSIKSTPSPKLLSASQAQSDSGSEGSSTLISRTNELLKQGAETLKSFLDLQKQVQQTNDSIKSTLSSLKVPTQSEQSGVAATTTQVQANSIKNNTISNSITNNSNSITNNSNSANTSNAFALSEQGSVGAAANKSITNARTDNASQKSLDGASSNIKDTFNPVINNFLEQGVETLNRLPEVLSKATPLVDSISNGVSTAVDSLMSGVSNISELTDWLSTGAADADAFSIATKVLSTTFAVYQNVMTGVEAVTTAVTAAQELLNLVMSLNPIGIVVLAVGGLIAAFVIAYKKFSGFRAMVDGVWAAIKTIGSNIIGMFTKIPHMVIDAIKGIPDAVMRIFSGVGDLFGAIFSGRFSDVPGILKKIGGGVVDAIPITSVASKMVTEATKGVGDAYSQAHKKSEMESKAAKDKEAKEKAEKEKEAQATRAGVTANARLAQTNNTSGKAVSDTVSGGGPKVVNITLGKFFDKIQFTTLNSGESAQELENVVTECLARVLYNGSKLV